MADFILVTGDIVMFDPAFGPATIIPIPGTLSGTGRSRLDGKVVCVEGDEKNVLVSGVTYMSGSFTIPGVGMLKIDSLGGDQKATATKSGGKAVLLKGSTFTAKLQIMVPAMQPPPGPGPPIPDPMTQYTGTGKFITTNMKVKGK